MAKRAVTTEETCCDRCGRRVTKSGGCLTIVEHKPVLWNPAEDPTLHRDDALDLCKGCGESLQKWWARGGGGEA